MTKEQKVEKRIRIPIGSSMIIECKCGNKHKFVNTPEGAFYVAKFILKQDAPHKRGIASK